MFRKDQQEQRDLFESERNFRLLVEGVADYALYMLDPTGVVTSWNVGGERIKAQDKLISYDPGQKDQIVGTFSKANKDLATRAISPSAQAIRALACSNSPR